MADKLSHEFYERLKPVADEIEDADKDFHQIYERLDNVISTMGKIYYIIKEKRKEIQIIKELCGGLGKRMGKLSDESQEIEQILPTLIKLYLKGGTGGNEKISHEFHEQLSWLREEIKETDTYLSRLYRGITEIEIGIDQISMGARSVWDKRTFAKIHCKTVSSCLDNLSSKMQERN